MNKSMLRSVMTLHGDNYRSLAAALGISPQSLCAKANERGTEFRQSEIVKIKRRYQLTAAEVDAIFFSV